MIIMFQMFQIKQKNNQVNKTRLNKKHSNSKYKFNNNSNNF